LGVGPCKRILAHTYSCQTQPAAGPDRREFCRQPRKGKQGIQIMILALKNKSPKICRGTTAADKVCFGFNQLAVILVAEEIFGRDMKGLGNWLGGDLPDQSVFKHWNSQHRTSKANSFHYIPWTQVDRLFGLNLKRALRILDKQHAPRPAKRHSS